MQQTIGALASLLATVLVVRFLMKRYQTQMVLFAAGIFLMVVAILIGAPSSALFPAKTASTGFIFFDIFRSIDSTISYRIAGTGLVIMAAGGFAKYMDIIGASHAMVALSIAPLRALKAPYVMLVLCFAITIVLKMFIPSAAGLAMLLMVTIYPILLGLGVSPAAAGAVIITGGCLDIGPSNVNTNVSAKLLGMDVAEYFVVHQIPVAVVGFLTIAALHYVVQRHLDKKDGNAPAFNPELEHAAVAVTQSDVPARPGYYAILPTIPLILLLVFSKIGVKSIKLDVPTAMIISLVIAMLCEAVHRKGDVKAIFKEAMSFFDNMGRQFATVISLVVAGEFFAQGLSATGTIDMLINAAQSAGFPPTVMVIVMTVFIVLAGIVMGSGQAPFFAFSSLAPKLGAEMGVPAVHILVPMQFGAGLARGISPIAAVTIAVSGISGISPFELVRRSIIPMGAAAVTTTITSLIVN